MRLSLLLLASLTFTSAKAADIDFWPGARYDASIPTVADVLGYESGKRITTHRNARRYFAALAGAAPERVRIVPYATSWQGRELYYVIVTAAANMARIEAIKSGMQALRDPRQTGREAANRIIASQPPVTWLSYGVHGNETSPTDAAMLTAYHLLAASNDERVQAILKDTVVIIDPLQNPDGRERFILRYEMARGLLPDPDRLSAEQNEPWPSGRTNHYLFDMNRDWFMLTQPETRGRIDAIKAWYPVAFVDAHEMGSDSTYFFAPEAAPYNPHLAAEQRANLELFGRNNARWFDRFGIDYFTREVFDAFYPGYGASWPSYFGSVAMTYEQGSARGLVVHRYDGSELSYRETIRNHFVASLATAETVASNRERLLRDFYAYQVSAIEEGRRESPRAYLVPSQTDQAGADKLAGLLVRQGVEVQTTTTGFRACGQDYGAGSYVIVLAQPAKRLIRTLLDPEVPMDAEFLAEQERKRAKALADDIYDVTAWSLPLMMNLSVTSCDRVPQDKLVAAGPELVQPGELSGPGGAIAYLVRWGDASAIRLLAHAHRRGLTVKSSDLPFSQGAVSWPGGTLIFDSADNPPALRAMLTELAATSGADIVAIDDTWVDEGPSFGSRRVVRMNAPRVAIAWDEPTNQYSAGNTRFVIERQFDYPVTAIRSRRLIDADLRRYDVLILPETRDGGYMDVLGKEASDNLRRWVQHGGVLIALGNATSYLADPAIDLLSIRRENRVVASEVAEAAPEADDGEAPPRTNVEGSYLESLDEFKALTAPLEVSPDRLGGVLLRAVVDSEHWLGAGVSERLNVLVRGADIYTPMRLDKGVNVARFEGPDNVLSSGYMWQENRKQYAFKPFAVVAKHGAGFVVAFTEDPNVRAYLDGLNLIFMNAVFRGAAHARPVR